MFLTRTEYAKDRKPYHAKGMSQCDIADTIEDIYGFEISHETISNITDQVIETANEWQNRPLKKFYSFVFVDCLYVNIRKEMVKKLCCICCSRIRYKRH